MRKNMYSIIIGFLICPILLFGQEQNFDIFRKAIQTLDQENQKRRPELLEKVELLKKEIEKDKKDNVEIMVLGKPEVEETPIKVNEKTIINTKVPEKKHIQYTSIPMFASEEKGTIFKPKTIQNDKAPLPMAPRASEEKFIMSEESVVFTETILIDDIKDPVEKKYWQNLAAIEQAVTEIRYIDFWSVLNKTTSTLKEYDKVMKDIKSEGFDLDQAYEDMKSLDKDEKVDFIKSKIVSLTEKLVTI